MDVAEIILDLLEYRRGGEAPGDAVAVDRDFQGFAGAFADDALHVGETVDGLTIDRHDQVAGLKSGGSGCAVGLHGIDPRAHGLLAVQHEDSGKNHYRQKEICHRSGHDDGRPLAYAAGT